MVKRNNIFKHLTEGKTKSNIKEPTTISKKSAAPPPSAKSSGECFCLNEKEEKRAKKFLKKYKADYLGAIGGSVTYSFTQTGIGTRVSVSILHNGEKIKKDITDYDSW